MAKLDVEDEATFKKFRPRGTDPDGQLLTDLVPLKENWPTLRIEPGHPGHIIGTVIERQRFLRR